jgi:hypothetical protein
MVQVSIGVTLEQAQELQAPYASYCARLEQLGAKSAAALASVQGVQQVREAADCTLPMDLLFVAAAHPPQPCVLCPLPAFAACPPTRLRVFLPPHPAPTCSG